MAILLWVGPPLYQHGWPPPVQKHPSGKSYLFVGEKVVCLVLVLEMLSSYVCQYMYNCV